MKLPGREDELAEALRERGLVERSMVSTMELSTLEHLRRLEPDLRRGWTYPKVTRDWTARRWAVPLVLAGLLVMRRRRPVSPAASCRGWGSRRCGSITR